MRNVITIGEDNARSVCHSLLSPYCRLSEGNDDGKGRRRCCDFKGARCFSASNRSGVDNFFRLFLFGVGDYPSIVHPRRSFAHHWNRLPFCLMRRFGRKQKQNLRMAYRQRIRMGCFTEPIFLYYLTALRNIKRRRHERKKQN